MKPTQLLTALMLMMLPVMLTGCSSDDNPEPPADAESLAVAETLPHYTVPAYESWSEVDRLGYRTLVINSLDELHELFTDSTLAEESPEYLDVDYDRYTLLVQYHVLKQKIESRRYYYYRLQPLNSNVYRLCTGYVHGDLLTDGEILVDRIAVVVDKLPDSARVQWAESIIEPK